jgi:hypothetical protein
MVELFPNSQSAATKAQAFLILKRTAVATRWLTIKNKEEYFCR